MRVCAPTLCVSNSLRPHSPPGSSVHGIFQNTRVVAISYPRGSFRPRDRNCIPRTGRLSPDFIDSATWEAHMRHLRCQGVVTQSCPTLCDPMDYSLPGSSVHGIFQARVLEWGSHFLLQGDLPDPGIKPGSSAVQADALPSKPPGKPHEAPRSSQIHHQTVQ